MDNGRSLCFDHQSSQLRLLPSATGSGGPISLRYTEEGKIWGLALRGERDKTPTTFKCQWSTVY